MEQELLQKYSELHYLVHVRLSGVEQGTQSYYVSRDLFNRILVDRPIRFQASGSPIPKIDKLLENVD